jgi:RNA polymerase sigma-70 factor (ECF subfamily)
MPTDLSSREKFEQSVTRYADSLYRVAYRLTGSEDRAEELVQETFLNAWKGIDSLQDLTKLRGWMFAILRNQYSKSMRREAKVPATNALSMNDVVDTDKVHAESNDQIQLALSRLDEEQRLPILLVTMEDLSVAEAAEILQIPKGTVLSRMHRGKQRLREILNSGILT